MFLRVIANNIHENVAERSNFIMLQKPIGYYQPLLSYQQIRSFPDFGQSYPRWSKLPRLTVLFGKGSKKRFALLVKVLCRQRQGKEKF